MTRPDRAPFRVALLGDFTVHFGDTPINAGGSKQRTVLGVLALDRGRVVPVASLIHAVWGPDAHEGAPATLQVYVSKLRRLFAQDSGEEVIAYRPPGYVLDARQVETDLSNFRHHVLAARDHVRHDDLAQAAASLDDAMAEWRGDPLSGLDTTFLAEAATALDSEFRAARQSRIHVEVERGNGADVLDHVRALHHQHPLDESVAGLHMRALYQAGRQADALQLFRQVRERLDNELGLEPGADLRAVEQAVLRHDSGLLRRPPAKDGDATTFRWDPAGQRTAYLIVDGRTRVEVDRTRLVIGRGADCDVVVAHGSVSRAHAAIEADGSSHVVVDLASTNGTYVNGERLPERQPRALVDGDEIGIGARRIVYRAAGAV